MAGRRTAAFLCVLLAHALAILALEDLLRPSERRPSAAFEPVPITIYPDFEPEPPNSAAAPTTIQPVTAPAPQPRATPPVPVGHSAPPAGESQAADFVDWPIEQRLSAKRALDAEREAERVAKLFSGPDGTWASLTKRERSRLKKFRWKKGVDGFEYDEKGNAIFHISDGCVIVNMAFIGCALGKAKVHGDLFKDMRLYFDEQRLPQNDDGNGTEPEALRPAN
jgi:hypothetical protein